MILDDSIKMVEFMNLIKSNVLTYEDIKNKALDLINDGIDICTQDEEGNTLLNVAVNLKDINLVRLFLELNVNPNIANETKNAPIHYSIIEGMYDILVELVNGGSDIFVPTELEQTPLHLATYSGNLKMVKFLIEKGADINFVDENNVSVIDYAIDEKNKEILKYFLSLGVDYEHQIMIEDILSEE